MKEDIAEIIEQTLIDGSFEDCAEEILTYISKNIQVPVECLKCNGHGRLPLTSDGHLSPDWDRFCPDCKNGWTTRPSTIEDFKKGGVLRKE